VFLYLLIATVGMQMNIGAIFTNPVLFGIGFTWIAFHAVVMLVVARLIRAPTFFLAVGSQANIGGAASAPWSPRHSIHRSRRSACCWQCSAMPSAPMAAGFTGQLMRLLSQ
jgi:hypothetical protein